MTRSTTICRTRNKLTAVSFALLIILAFCSGSAKAQGPGGITVGMNLWLKANAGVSGTTPISAWNNQAPGGPTVLVNADPWLSTPTPLFFNYNPVMNFNRPSAPPNGPYVLPNGWASDRDFLYFQGYSDTNGIDYRSLFFVLQTPNDTLPNQHLATVSGITSSIPSSGTLFGGIAGGGPAIQNPGYDDNDFGTLAPAGTWQINGSNVNYNAGISGSGKIILSGISQTGGSCRINTLLGGQLDPTDTSLFHAHDRDYDGWVSEIVGYTSSLTSTERQKIHSYLAVKYTISLQHNYLSANGTTIFSLTPPYTSSILGIGRDDASALVQKQSRTNTGNFRVYISGLASSNAGNSGVFSQDNSFVVIGSNNQPFCNTVLPVAEVPTGLTSCNLYSRMANEWKVTKTNFSQTFRLAIDLPSCAAPGAVTVAHLRLLVDDDGNFSNGGTQCFYNGDGTGIGITYSNPTLTISNISNTHIPDNSTRYITIGSISNLTPLPIELDYFTAVVGDPGINLQWQTLSEQNNAGFIVEKSSDSQNWEMLGFVNGAGNSNIPVQYALTDTFPQQGINYYRLTQVDYDGAYSDAAITSLNYQGNVIDLPYPNPGNGKYFLDNTSLSDAKVDIFNHLGAKVNGQLYPEGNGRWILDISDAADGIYFVHITRKESSQLFKLIKYTP